MDGDEESRICLQSMRHKRKIGSDAWEILCQLLLVNREQRICGKMENSGRRLGVNQRR